MQITTNEPYEIPKEIFIERQMTVNDLLNNLGISKNKFFAVLVNGKKVDESYIVEPSDKIVILPLIAGG